MFSLCELYTKLSQSGDTTNFDTSFNMRFLISFVPEALPDARDLRTLSTSIEIRMIELKPSRVTMVWFKYECFLVSGY